MSAVFWKKYDGIAQKSAHRLMQMRAFDDDEEEKDACAGPWKEGKDGEYEKSICSSLQPGKPITRRSLPTRRSSEEFKLSPNLKFQWNLDQKAKSMPYLTAAQPPRPNTDPNMANSFYQLGGNSSLDRRPLY